MPLAIPTGLTAAQAAIWLGQQLFPGKPVYNTGQYLTIPGPLQFDLFEKALRETIAECPALRLPPRLGMPTFALPVLDFRKQSDSHSAAQQWMQAAMREPIRLEDPALYRFALIRVADDSTIWFLKTHHIIIDVTGRYLMSARTAARYRALRFGEPLSPRNAATPEELLEAEARYDNSAARVTDRHYWTHRLASLPSPLIEGPRQESERGKSGRSARIAFKLKHADFARLEQSAKKLGSSSARAFVALSYAAFVRIYDRTDIVMGVDLANRSDARTKQTIGLMARPLPMPLALHRNATIADAVREIDSIRAQNYPHRHYPMREMIKDHAVLRTGHGLYDVTVNYVPITYDFAFERDPVAHTNLSYGFALPWMVTIAHSATGHDLDVTVDTDSGLVSTRMAVRLANSLEILFAHGLDDPACPISLLRTMPEAAREQVLAFAAGATVVVPEGETLASLCATQAKRTPNAIALICGHQQLDFATLHKRATQLARKLAASGVKPGTIVGIALPREPALIVAVLAVHKAGGAYLPLDPAYPAERIRFIVADAAAPIIITNPDLAPTLADSGARLVFEADAAAANSRVEPVMARPDDLAYVLYTSGSTGRPKAVGIEHRNLINFIHWGRSVVSDEELRGLLFVTSLNFDLSAFEMFLPLAFGGCIILEENLLALQASPHRDKVRLINTGPSVFDALLRLNALPSGVTTVILCGEKLTHRLAKALFDVAPATRLINCYGPTETTIYSSWMLVDPADCLDPPIGRPIWNTGLYVLDSGGELLPAGADGELYIGGAGVARGYLGRPELTAERFLPNPFGPGHIYRTGDRVRWRLDGVLEFHGRVDDQIKINGIRVEPGEIESVLLALPGVADAAVKLHQDANGRRLIAYLVRSPAATAATPEVRAALERQLPSYMVPAAFVWLEALPMTPNGKRDYKALPAPPSEFALAAGDQMPRTNLERDLAGIWRDILEKDVVDVHSDFFDLGGDSLALISLFTAIEARFGTQLTAGALSGELTVARLARMLEDGQRRLPDDAVVALQPHGHLPPFFCVHGVAGDVLHLRRLAQHMGTHRPFIGLRQANAPLNESIEEMAARYVLAMRKLQVMGPYYLGGHSFGATVAYEMARQLAEQGHEIGLLAIMDQRRPSWRMTMRQAVPVMHRILANLPSIIRAEAAQAPPGEKVKSLSRMIMRWSKSIVGAPIDTSLKFDLRHADAKLVSLLEANLRAIRRYQPKSSPVPIWLFRARTPVPSNLALDSTLGWSGLTRGGVRVSIVPGAHGSITAEPFVRTLAKSVSDALDVAQEHNCKLQ